MRYHQSSDPKWYTKYELFESGVANACVGNTQTTSSNNRFFLNDISQNEMKPASRTIDPAFGIDF